MNADEFIKALTDAIMAEQSKSGVSVADAKKKQKKIAEEEAKRVAKREEEAKEHKELESAIYDIVSWVQDNKSDMSKVKPILEACKAAGYGNPKEIDDVKIAKEILALTLK